MKNSKEIFRDLQQQITLKGDHDEIQSILYLITEDVLGLSRAEIVAEKSILLPDIQQKSLSNIIKRVNAHEPIQYILGSTYFYGRKFKVNSSVLIPRPETELLIEEVLKEIDPFTPGTILDIGTGSGCIAITLAKELPEKRVLAVDISEDALAVAQENASNLNASVEFHKLNALTDVFPFPELDIIVSNPPYVTLSEKASMKKNVTEYEPHVALFVPDDDPMIFYNAITTKAFSLLKARGKVFVEINEKFGNSVAAVFRNAGFASTRIVKDLQGKDRIVMATKSFNYD